MDKPVLTVNDLVTTQSLGTKVLAGAAGLGREVLWAHSCELSDPHKWLAPHELLMTVGLCVPASGGEQREFIAELDRAGLAGIALGDHSSLPSLTSDLLDEADARAFPVLLTNSTTPFAAIGRTIAAATATTQTMQVLKLSKLYQLATYARDNPIRMMDDLQTLFQVRLSVMDTQTGLVILEGPTLADTSTSMRSRLYSLPGDTETKLRVFEHPGEELSSFLLIHILQVIDMAVNQRLRFIRRRSERGAAMLSSVLDEHLPDGIESILGAGAISGGFQCVAIATEDGPTALRGVSIAALPVLAGFGRSSFLLLMPEQRHDEVRSFLNKIGIRAAASSTYVDLRDAKYAAEEALRVFSSAGTNKQWDDFAGVPISLLTRSRKEACAIVEQVLGSLAGADAKSSTLRDTLFTFISNDRRWNETSAALGIHRQTLSYRLAKIKDITGRDVGSSADLSAFWLAFQAWPSYSEPLLG
ncbi:transcciptional activator PmfR [Paenarthrobacter nitroguajacolicus]|uniref:transcciptional activator PmfR n=1 Tax=Paenarthrobacter nitroguajacolicus TaxID=211146 RepID=UPI00344822A3